MRARISLNRYQRPLPFPDPRKSEKHLANIRKLPCAVYGTHPVEAHHLLRADETRGMGRRSADRYAIPLGPKAHRELHAKGDEDAYLSSKGVDGRYLAQTLWECKSLDDMQRVMFRHLLKLSAMGA